MSTVCGIDFGTSNSTIGIAHQGKAKLIKLENDQHTLPSALFFNYDEQSTSYGRQAIAEYIDGEHGRLMRSLKSILGTSLMKQGTHINQQAVTYNDIIAAFIHELKSRAQIISEQYLSKVVAGRPVHFVDNDKSADTMAQNALEGVYKSLGFQFVEFQFEPIAAAINYEQTLDQEELALIVDIGGGTSDFSIIRLSPESRNKADRIDDILTTSGVHIGGNDFDRSFNLSKAMPMLGFNSHMGGASRRRMPSSHFYDLATWHLIHNQYDRKNIHQIESLRIHAEQPELLDRLVKLLKYQDGHRLISLVEECKISLTTQETSQLDLSFIENELILDCSCDEFNEATVNQVNGIYKTIHDCLLASQTKAQQINSVFLTGGTTGLPAVRNAVESIFPNTKIVEGNRFGSVGMGLTIDAMRRFA